MYKTNPNHNVLPSSEPINRQGLTKREHFALEMLKILVEKNTMESTGYIDTAVLYADGLIERLNTY